MQHAKRTVADRRRRPGIDGNLQPRIVRARYEVGRRKSRRRSTPSASAPREFDHDRFTIDVETAAQPARTTEAHLARPHHAYSVGFGISGE